jgi:hypothetical protein
VPADVIIRFKDLDLVGAVEQIGGDQAGNARADDGDVNGPTLRVRFLVAASAYSDFRLNGTDFGASSYR